MSQYFLDWKRTVESYKGTEISVLLWEWSQHLGILSGEKLSGCLWIRFLIRCCSSYLFPKFQALERFLHSTERQHHLLSLVPCKCVMDNHKLIRSSLKIAVWAKSQLLTGSSSRTYFCPHLLCWPISSSLLGCCLCS